MVPCQVGDGLTLAGREFDDTLFDMSTLKARSKVTQINKISAQLGTRDPQNHSVSYHNFIHLF